MLITLLAKFLFKEACAPETTPLYSDHIDMTTRLSRTELSCPVCLKRLTNRKAFQELGKPESCDHFFCFTCILEWSKVSPAREINSYQVHRLLPRVENILAHALYM